MRLNLSQKSWVYLSFFSLLCLISKAVDASSLQLGILVEPGYEYRTLKDLSFGGSEYTKEDYKMAGLSGSAIAQFMFVTKGPLVPFLGLGYNYTQLEGKKTIQDVDTKLTFKAHQSAIVEAGLGFTLSKKIRLEVFGDYQQLLAGDIKLKVGDDELPSNKVDTKFKFGKNMKYRVGARFFVTAGQRFDFGLSGAYNLGKIRSKDEVEGVESDYLDYNGFQANLVLRMRLGNTK